jgi:hypothetical protein
MMTPVTATHACVEAVVLAWKGRATQEQALVQAGQVARVVRDAWLATEKAVAATKETDAAAVVAVEVDNRAMMLITAMKISKIIQLLLVGETAVSHRDLSNYVG